MFVKFSAYFLLIIFLMPLVSSAKLAVGNLHHITSATAIMVTMTSFGFAAIVPSLRIYFAGDTHRLKKAIVIGSAIPLICYIVWDIAIMGVIPHQGLMGILNSDNSTSDLVNTLSETASNPSITIFIQLFTSICVLTSFLGVALCLTDFWADALQLEKKGSGNFLIIAMIFLPPLIVVLFFPNIFVTALKYAGIYCMVLLVFLPAWMVWAGRYHRKHETNFTVPGGKLLLVGLFLISIIIIGQGLWGE